MAYENIAVREKEFILFSSKLTAFNQSKLYGTGQASVYFQTVLEIVGFKYLCGMLDFASAQSPCKVLEDECYGAIAKSTLKLWLTGIWNPLPSYWHEKFGALPLDIQKVVSEHAFASGLVWEIFYGHPPAHKQPGFGSWSVPPVKNDTIQIQLIEG